MTEVEALNEVPSDLELEGCSVDSLDYGWHLLLDVTSDFQGSGIRFTSGVVVLPILSVLSVLFEWTEREPFTLLAIGGVLTIGCLAVAIHSWFWFFWLRKRLRRIEARWRETRREFDGEKGTLG